MPMPGQEEIVFLTCGRPERHSNGANLWSTNISQYSAQLSRGQTVNDANRLHDPDLSMLLGPPRGTIDWRHDLFEINFDEHPPGGFGLLSHWTHEEPPGKRARFGVDCSPTPVSGLLDAPSILDTGGQWSNSKQRGVHRFSQIPHIAMQYALVYNSDCL